MAAHANLPTDLRLVAPKGRICIVGSKAQEVALNPRQLMPKQVDLRGVFLGSASQQELSALHSELYEALERRSLVPVISQQLPLRDAAKAHVEALRARSWPRPRSPGNARRSPWAVESRRA